jgi:hypothetical protein
MPDLTADRLELLDRFRSMYVGKHFEASAFDLDGGYLQTTLADDARMPLRFFVEYNNAWWFAVISGVDVPMTSYDPASDSGAIVLDVDYEGETLRAMQHVHFGDGVINRIRTYASGAFFDRPTPLVSLDRHGNTCWLETGYDLATSLDAAQVFLRTPHGRRYAEDPATAPAVARIEANLEDLAARLTPTPRPASPPFTR